MSRPMLHGNTWSEYLEEMRGRKEPWHQVSEGTIIPLEDSSIRDIQIFFDRFWWYLNIQYSHGFSRMDPADAIPIA